MRFLFIINRVKNFIQDFFFESVSICSDSGAYSLGDGLRHSLCLLNLFAGDIFHLCRVGGCQFHTSLLSELVSHAEKMIGLNLDIFAEAWSAFFSRLNF
jgi:hypothetical protein